MGQSYARTCVFCVSSDEMFGNTPDFKRLVGDRTPHRILFETENFVVLPSLGQIVEGYLLIMPKNHYNSFALLHKNLYNELESVYRETREVLHNVYSTPIFYEHGIGTSKSRNGCCVDHAHIHAIPVPLKISPTLCKEFECDRIQKLKDLAALVRGKDYLFLEDSTGERYVYHASNLKAQYVRYLVADLLGTPEKGDWMLYPGVEELLATIRKLSFWREYKLRSAALLAYSNTNER